MTNATPFRIGMLIFDGMTNLDFAGPHDVFGRLPNTEVHIIAKSAAPVVTDLRARVLPTISLSETPELDLIFIGGGPGTTQLMEDDQIIDFLRKRAPAARWITSVCTGALVLGAAGLLRGYKAATHWAAMEILKVFEAEPVYERVVVDRNRITGGGVTAGIDFGLNIANLLHGKELAQGMQLGMEYDPQPPFNAGSPRSAPEEIVARTRANLSKVTEARFSVARRVVQAKGWN
jgi:cyclohexyl-isocyanide hydratase